MDISEKILKFAENQKTINEKLSSSDLLKSYENGHSIGYSEGKTEGYTDGYTAGVSDGRQAEYDSFWDTYQQNGKRSHYQYAFARNYWIDDLYNPKYPIGPVTTGGFIQVFGYNQQLTDTKVSIESCGAYLDNTFIGCVKLKKIPSLVVDSETTYKNTFHDNICLEVLNIQGTIGQNDFNVQWSTELSHESLMSIVNALEDKTGDTSGTTWVVTLGSENMAKLSAEELSMISNKGWNCE